MRSNARGVTAIASIVLLGLAACGGDDNGERAVERAIERSGGGDVDVDIDDDNGGYRIETADGSLDVSTSGELPADWPGDVPLPDGFEITGASSIDGGSAGQLVSVTGVVAASIEEIDAFYADALSDWTEALRTSSTNDGVRSFTVAYEQTDRHLSVGGQERDGQSEIGFTYTYQPTEGEAPVTSIGLDGDIDVDVDDLGIPGAREALDALSPETLAGALVSALDADRHEIVDDTIHVYLGDDSSYSAQIACIVGTGVVDDLSIVIHDAAGAETAC